MSKAEDTHKGNFIVNKDGSLTIDGGENFQLDFNPDLARKLHALLSYKYLTDELENEPQNNVRFTGLEDGSMKIELITGAFPVPIGFVLKASDKQELQSRWIAESNKRVNRIKQNPNLLP